METRELDLGGGWKATVKRPPFFRWYQWIEHTSQKQDGAPSGFQEQGHDAQPIVPVRIGADFYRFLETEYIPDVVVAFTAPDGSRKKPGDVYLPDLKIEAITKIGLETMQMMGESEGSFRGNGDPESQLAASGVPTGEAYGKVSEHAPPRRRRRSSS